MLNSPNCLLCLLGPTPEPSPSNCGWFITPDVLVQVETIAAANLVDHKPHLVCVNRLGLASFDLRREIRRRNFALANGHVTHLWTNKRDTVTRRVNSIVAH